jgi:GT2 family glycosyltransferase
MNPVTSQDTAIAIVAYNRPDYFQQMINALDANDIPDSWRIHAYLDGGPNASQDENERIIRNARLGDRITIIKRASNYGTGRNIIGARRGWQKLPRGH